MSVRIHPPPRAGPRPKSRDLPGRTQPNRSAIPGRTPRKASRKKTMLGPPSSFPAGSITRGGSERRLGEFVRLKSAKESLSFRSLSYPCVLCDTKETRPVAHSRFPGGAVTGHCGDHRPSPRGPYTTPWARAAGNNHRDSLSTRAGGFLQFSVTLSRVRARIGVPSLSRKHETLGW